MESEASLNILFKTRLFLPGRIYIQFFLVLFMQVILDVGYIHSSEDYTQFLVWVI